MQQNGLHKEKKALIQKGIERRPTGVGEYEKIYYQIPSKRKIDPKIMV